MKFLNKWTMVLAAAAALFLSCQPVPSPDRPQHTGEVTIQLPASLDSKMNHAYNGLHWSEDDQPLLVRVGADQNFMSQNATAAQLQEDGSIRFSFHFPQSSGSHRFWFCQNGRKTSAGDARSIEEWNLQLPDVQTPTTHDIDPDADVLVSGLSFSLDQDYLSSNRLQLKLHRLNAVAELQLTGIPADHILTGLTITAPVSICGKRSYQVIDEILASNYVAESQIKVHFTPETERLCESDGTRKIRVSLWPAVLERYRVTLQTKDAQGVEHEFQSKAAAFAPSVLLESQCLTEWPLEMKDVQEIPVFPPTPVGPEDVLHGQQGATLDLFKKIKAYEDNGISMVEDWWTHRLGYEGITIHEAKVIQYGAPVHLWVMEVDPNRLGFALGTPYDSNRVPAPSLQRVSGQAQAALKSGKKVVAAINGDAWGARGANYTYGVMFKDGECLKNWAVLSNDIANKDTFYALDDGRTGIADENAFASIVSSSNVETAIGGWYRIISQGGESYAQAGARNGDPLLRDKTKTSGNLRNFLDRQPRTLIGMTDDRVYLVVADGRQSGWSVGLTLNGCARILYSLGCKRGINLDGGGSSVMIKKQGNGFKVLDRPSDGAEREVANSLLVIAR